MPRFVYFRGLIYILDEKKKCFLSETIQVSYAGIGFFAADIVMTMILVCGACQVIIRRSHLLTLIALCV